MISIEFCRLGGFGGSSAKKISETDPAANDRDEAIGDYDVGIPMEDRRDIAEWRPCLSTARSFGLVLIADMILSATVFEATRKVSLV